MAVVPATTDDQTAPMGRLSRAAALGVKRLLDVVAAFLALVVLLPVFLVIAAAIAVVDGRPIFYSQTRVGRHGKHFTMYKFRTLDADADSQTDALAAANERTGPLFKLSDDPRATRTGQVLRRTSLDELPQFFNVLRGDMSVVGPRPALPAEVAQFPSDLRRREELPQGLTGLWQLDGRTNADFGKYTELDLRYIDEWSLGLDLSLVLRTPVVVLRHAWASCAIDEESAPAAPAVLELGDGTGDVTIDLREGAEDTTEVTIDLRDPAVDVIDLREGADDMVPATGTIEEDRHG